MEHIPTRAERRRLERAHKRYEARGCAKCGRHSAPGMPVFIADRAYCSECGPKSIPAGAVVAVVLQSLENSAHVEDDRDFFAKHPDRWWRVRKPGPNEVQELSSANAQTKGAQVLVVKISPVTRSRALVAAWASEEDLEAVAYEVLDEAQEAIGSDDRQSKVVLSGAAARLAKLVEEGHLPPEEHPKALLKELLRAERSTRH